MPIRETDACYFYYDGRALTRQVGAVYTGKFEATFDELEGKGKLSSTGYRMMPTMRLGKEGFYRLGYL